MKQGAVQLQGTTGEAEAAQVLAQAHRREQLHRGDHHERYSRLTLENGRASLEALELESQEALELKSQSRHGGEPKPPGTTRRVS